MKQRISYLIVLILSVGQAVALDLERFSVDFEISMGENDSYMAKYYEYFFKNVNKKGNFGYLKPYKVADLIELCKKNYNKNKPGNRLPSDQKRIPRIFHQIWIGDKPFPEKYRKWQKTWQSIPGWKYKLWTNEDVESLDLYNKDLFYKEKNFGARADILRVEILYRFGGVYIDTDFELLQPEFFNFLNSAYDFFTGLTPIDSFYHWNELMIANGIIGSVAGHPILNAYIKHLRLIDPAAGTIVKGPGLFTKMVLMHAGENDIIFPPTFFYPVGNMQMQAKAYRDITNHSKKTKMLKKDCCRPESAAVHWWEGSWESPDAQAK